MFKYLNYLITFLIFFTLFSCVEEAKRPVADSSVIRVDSINAPDKDTTIYNKVKQYSEPLEEVMSSVLVYSEKAMKRGTPEGLLNNFVADLALDIGLQLYDPEDQKSIDFCLLNYGGLRTSIPEGAVTKSRVYELMPFENELVVVTLTSEKTKELFKYLAQSDKGMPVSGLRLGIRNSSPEAVEIRGEPFDENRNYKVLTSDYLAHGGDNMTFFLQPVNYELVGIKLRDAIIKHMRKVNEEGEKISAGLDERIFYLQ